MRRLPMPRPPIPSPGLASVMRFPAPLGGMNAVSGGAATPLTDSIYTYNMIGDTMGLRVRTGYTDVATLAGTTDPVRSMHSFASASGGNDRLFACRTDGIYNAETGVKMVSFTSGGLDSGRGSGFTFSNAIGHFYAYFDEQHGYYLYRESTGTWVRPTLAASNSWQASTAYTAGDLVLNDSGKTYRCATTGVSAGSGGPTGTGAAITDGTAVWEWAPVVSGVDPSKLVFGMVWKNRIWAVERDTGTAWYFGLNAVYGAATAFYFGAKFRAGGSLLCMTNWTRDGAEGPDDYLAAVSSQGDVVIYHGTDPDVLGAFAIAGVWYVGALPAGRSICTNFGGDALLMSSQGLIPLSRLTAGSSVQDRTQYLTFKIDSLFAQLVALYGTNRGWSICTHPQDNALLVTIPTTEDGDSDQLAWSVTSKGWSYYWGLPLTAATVWDGTFYFGSAGGKTYKALGTTDNGTAIQWSCLSAYPAMSSGGKRPSMARVMFTSNGGIPPFEVDALFNYSVEEGTDITYVAPTLTGGYWGVGLWGRARWGSGADVPVSAVRGLTGMGATMALRLRGCSKTKVTYVGSEVTFTAGGFL